jgi:hypothetical protein
VSKRVWKSAVARMLVQQHRERPVPSDLQDRMIATSQKGFTAAQCAALLASRLAQGHTSDDSRIDLLALSSKIHLLVEYQPLALEAILQHTDAGFRAVINSTLDAARQRMALAHEIGHVVLYTTTGLSQSFGHISLDERVTSESQEIEDLCDCFADELVMPSKEWGAYIKNQGLSLSTLKELSKTFGVSIMTAAKRMVEVCLLNCMIILWKPLYDDGIMSALQPIHVWTRLPHPYHFLNQTMMRTESDAIPGAPFYAWETQAETAGKLLLSMPGLTGSYLAHSERLSEAEVITLLLPTREGWEKMFPQPRSQGVTSH